MEHSTIQAAVLVGALLLLSKTGEEAAERLRLPGFVGSVLMGLLLSDAVLGLVKPSELAPAIILFILGINFTLFLAGVEELSDSSMLRPNRREMLVSALVLAAPSVAVGLLLWLTASITAETALALGVTMAIVSAGPLMKILLAKGGLGQREYSALKVGLTAEVAGLIFFNTLVQGVALIKFVETVIFVAAIYMFGRHYFDELLMFIERHMAVKEAPFAIVVSIVIMAGYIAEMMGFNAAVTALLLGVFLSEYMELRPLYLERIRAFTYGFLEPLFFIGIGIYAVKPTPITLAYTAAILGAAAIPKILAAKALGFHGRETLVLLAKGGVDAALLLALLQAYMIPHSLYTAALLAIVVSTILSSISFPLEARKPDVARMKLTDLELEMDIVHANERASYAARIVAEKGAAVVVDEKMRPIGYVVAEDFVDADPRLLDNIPARFFLRTEVPIVRGDTTIVELISDHSLLREPILAVVNMKGELIGTLTPKKLLEILIGLNSKKKEKHRDMGL